MFDKLKNLLSDRKKKGSAHRAEAQDIFKKTITGGKRSWSPKNESRSDNKEYKRILKAVKEARKDKASSKYPY